MKSQLKNTNQAPFIEFYHDCALQCGVKLRLIELRTQLMLGYRTKYQYAEK